MTTEPIRICVCSGCNFFYPSCTVTGARHTVISQALWEQGDGMILTPGPPSPSPDKGFSWTRKSFKLVKDQRARSVKTSPEAALLPLLLLSVWSYTGCETLTDRVFMTVSNAAIRVNSLFFLQIFLTRIYWILFCKLVSAVPRSRYCFKYNTVRISCSCFPAHILMKVCVCVRVV